MDELKDFLGWSSGLLQWLGTLVVVIAWLRTGPLGHWLRDRWALSSKVRAIKRIETLERGLRSAELYGKYPEYMVPPMLALVFVVFQRIIFMIVLLGIATIQNMVAPNSLVTTLFSLVSEYGSIFLAASAISFTAKGYEIWAHAGNATYYAEIRKKIEELQQKAGVAPQLHLPPNSAPPARSILSSKALTDLKNTDKLPTESGQTAAPQKD